MIKLQLWWLRLQDDLLARLGFLALERQRTIIKRMYALQGRVPTGQAAKALGYKG